jgi:hypothetical protein
MAAILLGNGFSIAYSPAMFSYDALVEGAEFPDRVRQVFHTLGTTDFEHVMRRLNQAHELLQHYDDSEGLRDALRLDSNLVRESLIHALTQYHPHRADLVSDEEKDQCANFLRSYDRIFTTNYDLLLYWVLYPRLRDNYSDGFRGYETIAWQNGEVDQDVFYLHGALHLYRDARRTIKRRYGGGVPILDQLDEAMASGEFPLFVSEGAWQQKLAAIEDSTYLKACYDALATNRQALTLYGFGFHPNDQHIVNAIAKSNTRTLEVVIYSRAAVGQKRRLRERARRLRDRLRHKQDRDVSLEFRESDEYQVWR